MIAAAENVASRVRSLLHFSVPDEGPLSDADTYMPDFMKLLATGIKKNVKSVVKAVQGLAGSMSSNLTTPVDSLGDWMDSVVGSFATTIKRSQSGIGSAARDVGSGIQSQLMSGLSGLKTQFQQLWTDLQGITKTAVGGMSDEVKQGFTDMKDSIGELSSQTSSLGNAIRSLGDTFNSDFLKNLGSGISNQMVLLLNSPGMEKTDTDNDNLTVTPFMQTSDSGYAVTENDQTQGQYILGAVSTNAISADSSDSDSEDEDDESDATDTDTKTARLTVLASASMISSDITDQLTTLDNLTLFVNSVTENFDNVNNVAIEAKSLSTETNTPMHAGAFSILVIFIIPLAILILGFVIWMRRRKA